jgi:hypothetical protein
MRGKTEAKKDLFNISRDSLPMHLNDIVTCAKLDLLIECLAFFLIKEVIPVFLGDFDEGLMGLAKVENVASVNVEPHGVQSDQAAVHEALHERVRSNVLQLVESGHLGKLIRNGKLVEGINDGFMSVIAFHEDQSVLFRSQHCLKMRPRITAITHQPTINNKLIF